MKLNRQAIQRMIDTGSVNVGGRRTGGSGGAGGGGGVSSTWVDENYVSKEFFSRLFTIHGHDAEDQNDPPTDIVVEPNDADTPIDSIEAMFGVWTEQFLTALGVGSGGSGGGGGALYLLADVIPNDSEDPQYVYGLTGDPQADDGKVLTFSGTFGHWIAAEPQGVGTIQEITITTPVGLLVNGGQSATITESDTFAITLDTGYYLLSESQYDILDNLRYSTWWGQPVQNGMVYGAMSNVPSIDNLLFFDTQDSMVSIQTGSGALFTFTFNNMVNPMLKMQVYGETGETVAMLLNGTELLINNNATKNLALFAAQTMLFDTGAVERMRIDSSGNVGIGTSNPAYTLDVNGYTKTNRLYLSANVYLEYDSQNSGVHLVGAGFYSDSFISALGLSSGGGGGVSLNEPLASINNAGLGAPSNGSILIYQNGSWQYGTTGGSGTVTRIATGTGLTGGPITSSGTISIDSTYQTYISHGETAYHNLSNYVQASAIKTLSLQGNGVNVVTFTPNGSANAMFNIEAASRLALTRGTNKVTLDLANSGVSTGTYRSVTVDIYGRVTNGTNPTQLAQYGITANDPMWSSITVYKAGQLATPRNIWGQSFNGTADISGNMTGVGNITIAGGSRINQTNGGTVQTRSLYIGSADNYGYVYFQDIASQSGVAYWTIQQSGVAKFAGTVTVGNLSSNGYVTALATSSSSDERMKNIIEHFALSVDDIAEAPMVKFTWKDKADKGVHVGSIAQYWLNVLPEAVPEFDDHYNLEYGTIALIASISIARTVVNHEERLRRIEKELNF